MVRRRGHHRARGAIGLTETSAASFLNRPTAYRFGTAGWPFPNTEVKIADDGEILLRGPGVMSGYHDLPDATAEALEQDGWFHTGGIGEIDADGFLRITDRKKDMFKTSQGKYVAPSPMAARFNGICPYVGEFIVYGKAGPIVSRWSALTAKRSPSGPPSTAWRASRSPRSRATRRPMNSAVGTSTR